SIPLLSSRRRADIARERYAQARGSREQVVDRHLDAARAGSERERTLTKSAGVGALEEALDGFAEKARGLAVPVPVVARARTVVVARGDVHVQPPARARERDVEEPALLGDAVLVAGGHVGGEVAVVGADEVHCVPLEAL